MTNVVWKKIVNNLSFIIQKPYYGCHINKYEQTNNNDHNLQFMKTSDNSIHIPLKMNQQTTYLTRYKNNNKLGIQIENDSINMLYAFYNKNSKFVMNKKTLYFYQWGVQNTLLDKTITLGLGKRYIHNNRHGVGYNTILNLPIIKNNLDLPYSINMGGTCWYYNFVFVLNGYYNLNQILYVSQPSYEKFSEFPMFGYQTYIQSIIPYISECRTQIKLEKFFYDKRHNKLDRDPNDDAHRISIGIGYKPIPILDISIDNVFINKKYFYTLLKITFNYQFNVPITHQIKQTHCSNNLLNSDTLGFVLKPFTPESTNIGMHNKISHRITGYSKEVKYIKINHSDLTTLKWNAKSFEENGGKIVHLVNNLYEIRLPEYIDSRSNKFTISYEEQDANNVTTNNNKVLISVEKITEFQTSSAINNDHSIAIENIQNPNNLNNTNTSDHNNSDQNVNTVTNLDNQNNVSLIEEHAIVDDEINTTPNTTSKSNDNSPSFYIPIPPSISESPLFIQQKTDISSSSNLNKSLSTQKVDHDQKTNGAPVSHSSEMANRSKNGTNSIENKSHNTQNLFEQLLIQKQTKFSSIGTQEYFSKLEKSILERKKHNCINDMEKLFHKLHASLSCSSVEDEWNGETNDDNTDSFSESSFVN